MAAVVGASVLQPNIQGTKLIAKLSNLGLIGLLLVLAAILTAAVVIQYGYGEIPCPLCLLQRVAMFGICFGLIHHFQLENAARGVGLALVSAVFLLFISGRQTLIDIYPRPGHSYVGSAVLGLHMPVWSVLIALRARDETAVSGLGGHGRSCTRRPLGGDRAASSIRA
ncbi:disulfide bond formation protein B [Methylobacterium sp. P31]